MIQNKAGLSRWFWFIGRVEDVMDPLVQGRVRVRCFGYHEDDQIKLAREGLPWAVVLQPTTSAGIHGLGHSGTGLVPGSHVLGFFADGVDAQEPIIIGTLGASLTADFSIPTNSTESYIPNSITGGDQSTNIDDNSSPLQLLEQDIIGVVGPLSQNELAMLKNTIGRAESGNKYNTTNTLGFIGKYQFGYAALIDTGFVNRSARSNSDLNNPSVWTGRMGVTSKETYLNNGAAQEAGMDALLRQNYRQLVRSGIVNNESPHDVVAGYLMVSHGQGVGSAIKLKSGTATKDGYGTSSAKYYALGRQAVQGTRVANR